MRIAVNTRHWTRENLAGLGYYTREVFTRMAIQHPEHSFVFIFNNEKDFPEHLPENVESVSVSLKKQNAFALKWWYDVKIPIALKKYKANVFISPEGICSLTASVPQVLLVPNLNFFIKTNAEPKAALFLKKKYMPAFLKKAKAIVTASSGAAALLVNKYSVERSKIIGAGIGINPLFKPLDWKEREAIKEEFAGGYEYFVFAGGNHPAKNLLNVLKAFSIFKKWQKSSMKLLVAGNMNYPGNPLEEKLKTYKHRDDVKLLGYLPEEKWATVVAGGYALVYPVFSNQLGLTVLEAMKSQLPVITSPLEMIKEIAGEAALFAAPNDPEEIAGQMKRIFKDEQLRNQLIKEGNENVAGYNWDETAQLMFSATEAAVSG